MALSATVKRAPVTRHPRFPGYANCLAMMRKRDPQVQEDGFHWLAPRAFEHLEELIKEFHLETDHGLRCWLLELIGMAKDARALPLLLQQMASTDEALRAWAIRGLERLDTHDSRKALFDGGARKDRR